MALGKRCWTLNRIVRLIYPMGVPCLMGRIQFQGFKCERCGHTWAPRQALDSKEPVPIPKVCPKCKSAWWDVPRKEKAIGKVSPPKGKGTKARRG